MTAPPNLRAHALALHKNMNNIWGPPKGALKSANSATIPLEEAKAFGLDHAFRSLCSIRQGVLGYLYTKFETSLIKFD